MRWPWGHKGSSDQLVVSWSGQTLAFVLARLNPDGTHQVLKLGVERQGADSSEDFVRRLQALGLKGLPTLVMLRPEQYQMLQIDAPAVAPDELRAAARYQVREMLQVHVDDVTLDVMRVGDGEAKNAGHLFVVVATHVVLRGVLELADAMHWTVAVIDIQETAQRNLQSALAANAGTVDRANAALVLVEGQQAMLTICANQELFYTRRFELPEGFLAASWGTASTTGAAPVEAVDAVDAFTMVDEYVPDASATAPVQPVLAATLAGDDGKAQHLLLEVQRSLDVWERTWSSMPLDGMLVYAGERSEELAKWLAGQLGQTVVTMDLNALFPGFERASAGERSLCLPLLGVLLRTESRQL